METVNSITVVWDNPDGFKGHLLGSYEVNAPPASPSTDTPRAQTRARKWQRRGSTVHRPVPLLLLSMRQVSWGATAMTFDPKFEQQERGYQSWSFSLYANAPQTLQDPGPEERLNKRRPPTPKKKKQNMTFWNNQSDWHQRFWIMWLWWWSKQCVAVYPAYQRCCNKQRNTQADLNT